MPAPTPISDALDRQLDTQGTRIPVDRRGQANVGVSTDGFEIGAGVKPIKRWRDFTMSGYTGHLWGGKGWTAGARAQVAW